MRFLRRLGVLVLGVFAGFAAAAAVVRRMLPSRGESESDEVALVAIFNGIELKSRATAFRGGSMLAWFGGIAVDLREAKLAPDAHLTVNAVFGGIAVKLPQGWRVERRLTAILGGVDVRAPEPKQPDAPRLVVNGFALLGGIAVAAASEVAE